MEQHKPSPNIGSFFQVGGSLEQELPSYIERKADKDLYKSLKRGEFCYVLSARQMGKSSLKVRTMKILAEEEKAWATASVDLTSIGTTGFTNAEWYNSFLFEIADALDIEQDFDSWWESYANLTPIARMSRFWEDFLLKEIPDKPILICIDEIDTMLSLSKTEFHTDDFFAAIRAIYNRRSNNPAYKRLNFAIFGVATPRELMSDHERTPFNIGQPVLVQNFSPEEALPLTRGFTCPPEISSALLDRILYWTGGQPFLTQELCKAVSQETCSEEEVKQLVDEQVKAMYLQPDVYNSAHFSNVQERIVANKDFNLPMLDLYQRIRSEGSYTSLGKGGEQLYLKLSGLVEERQGKLWINNRIYEAVFEEKWLEKAFANLNRPFSVDLQRWAESGRSADALLKGTVLEEAEQWARLREDLTKEENDFLQASRIAEQVQQEKDRQRSRMQRALVAVAITAIVAIAAGIFAFIQADLAKEQASLAEQKTEEAQAAEKRASESLEQFIQEQATRVSREVDDIIDRAQELKGKGYGGTPLWRNMLQDANSILATYPNNDSLQHKQAYVQSLLAP